MSGASAALVPGPSLRIGHARLHDAIPGDRERLADQLGEIRLTHIGMPDNAILIVPRLVAGARLSRTGDRSAFISSVTGALTRALQRARRPGEARSSGDPLLFVDENEAAATLIAQWLAGAAPGDRAWWPHLTGGDSALVWLRRRILPDARRLPALVAALARLGLAEALLERLEPDDIRTALAAMAEGCGLSLSVAALSRAASEAAEASETLARIDAIVPEARRSELAPQARLLLLVLLLAERRPALLGTRAARAALAAVAAGRPVVARPEPTRRGEPGVARRGAREAARGPGARPIAPIAERRAERSPKLGEASAPEEADRPLPARPGEFEPMPERREIATAFGGLLFLLNALLALGLYGDFSRPVRTLPGLSPFGLLRLLGRAWFGRAFVDDPLHDLLVSLAGGRRADRPRQFEAPSWSVPRLWLSPWPAAGTPTIGGHPSRPMLWHEAGFPLAELDPKNSIAAAVRAARRLGLRGTVRQARHPFLLAPARARWVACLRFYLEARLARALRSRNGAEAAATLCRRPARIALEGDALTARFALDDHPIAIRVAGLDRDPGWIPAARRDVRYAFQ